MMKLLQKQKMKNKKKKNKIIKMIIFMFHLPKNIFQSLLFLSQNILPHNYLSQAKFRFQTYLKYHFSNILHNVHRFYLYKHQNLQLYHPPNHRHKNLHLYDKTFLYHQLCRFSNFLHILLHQSISILRIHVFHCLSIPQDKLLLMQVFNKQVFFQFQLTDSMFKLTKDDCFKNNLQF